MIHKYSGIPNRDRNWIHVTALLSICVMIVGGCKKFLEVEPPNSKIPSELVFENDNTAVSAVVGMYVNMYQDAFASGGIGSLPWIAGLTADELHNESQINPAIVQLEDNEIQSDNGYIAAIWTAMYKSVYEANAIIEGLDQSSGITPVNKKQFKGEALFIRAFCYFYLTNIFGNIPIVLTTDYHRNASLSRMPQEQVYNQMEADLLKADSLLKEDYPSAGRVRPNRYTALALLSRVYLYRQKWQQADGIASAIIAKSDWYQLPENLNSVFLATSKEAIWQLKPGDVSSYTNDAYDFLAQGTTANGAILTDTVVNSFASSDKRRINWITNLGNFYRPYKYKFFTSTNLPSTEYPLVFRLAEQYLIRAEARAQLGVISGSNSAIADINFIRHRAGLTDTSANDLQEVMEIIERERKLELFSEWGHRWLDLKRWNKAVTVLAQLKPRLVFTDTYYPIPQKEINNNAYLKPQNSGY